MNRVNLAKSLVASKAIDSGEVITRDMLEIRSPGRGLQPNRMVDLIGRVGKKGLGQVSSSLMPTCSMRV